MVDVADKIQHEQRGVRIYRRKETWQHDMIFCKLGTNMLDFPVPGTPAISCFPDPVS